MPSAALWRAVGVLALASLSLLSGSPCGAETDAAGVLDLTAYHGKVVVVDFWASWCAPCRRSLPWLDAMQRRYADEGLIVIGVNEDNTQEDAAAFLQQVPVSFRIVPDPKGEIARRFELIAMPSTFVFGRDGELAEQHLGFKVAKQDEYEAVLRRLLATAPMAEDENPPDNQGEP